MSDIPPIKGTASPANMIRASGAQEGRGGQRPGKTPAAIADQVWEETLADHSGTAGSTAEALDSASAGAAGAGGISFTYTLTSSVDASPIPDADVWVTSDAQGNTVLASGQTDSNGQVTFQLDAGTVYVWRQKAGWNFTNPDEETVS